MPIAAKSSFGFAKMPWNPLEKFSSALYNRYYKNRNENRRKGIGFMKEKGILIRADYGHVALHLREIMEERGITRNQLAKRIDARFEVVNKWYQGELEKMDLDILARICYALDCTIEDLLQYIPAKK